MKATLLFGETLKLAIENHAEGEGSLLSELGGTDRRRLQRLLELSASDYLNLGQCLTELFGSQDDKAQTSMRSLRSAINKTAEAVGCDVRFAVDTDKKRAPSERRCWFTGSNPDIASAERFSAESVADIQGDPVVRSRATVSTGRALQEGKRVVRFFVSYAHDDDREADDFLTRFRKQFDAAKDYSLDLWIDRRIRTGNKWRAEILQALEDCEFGLLLVTPSFLGSEFITEHELPVFVPKESDTSAKPVVPVGLKVVDFNAHDLKGLRENQIYRRKSPGGTEQFFAHCRNNVDKDDFAHRLFLDVVGRLDEHFGPSAKPVQRLPRPVSPSTDAPAPFDDEVLVEHLRDWAPQEAKCPQRGRAHPTSFAELESLNGKLPSTEGRDALEELHEWVAGGEKSSVFCAVLGEYGIGKTTTLKMFTKELLDRRRTDRSTPLPIYIDLRLRLGESGAVPTLEQLLQQVIVRNHKLAHASPLTPATIIRLVREEGAVIMFDGLDEKIVHLPPAEAQAYIRELWKILPPVIRKADSKSGQRMGKMILSCRSHYFRDVLSQNAMLTGEDREGLKRGSDFKVLLMLPFSEVQIRAYLREMTGSEQRAAEAFAIIERIHNLRDLAQRPVLLNHITEHLAELEGAAVRNEVVNAARLYQLVVGRWLTRDDGKHQLDPAHKRLLMERLAGKLAAEGLREMSADELEAWLDQFLYEEPVVASAYAGRPRPVLKEDLRTATFVVRPESGEGSGSFRFAHTSLQEFFLACHLLRALKEQRPAAWDISMQTVETLHFVGQLLALEPEVSRARCLGVLGDILGSQVLRAACLAFQYWLEAIKQGGPEPTPTRIVLAGAEAEEWEIVGHGADRPINLRGADLRGIQLSRSRIRFVDASGANLTGAALRQSVLEGVHARGANLEKADLRGMQWRQGSLSGARLTETQLAGAEWINVDLDGAELPTDWDQWASSCGERTQSANQPKVDPRAAALLVRVGHTGSVRSCAWSPDGKQLAS
ncbi:MAG: pentapeptide repeat-containing protein, partial [Verrucomicrobiales bacterium]|nr:pentapeptide repeat-containing protein [Verrucomicrobiales bacterium]